MHKNQPVVQVKTISSETFVGSPVNVCSVESESAQNQNLIKMTILHAPVIRRDSIPSLNQRFVLILRVYMLENVFALILKKCSFFWFASLF